MKSVRHLTGGRRLAVAAAGMCWLVCGLAADTWYWYGGTQGNVNNGFDYNVAANWRNAATGETGVPADGDFIIYNGDKSATCRSLNNTDNGRVYGGVLLETAPRGNICDQGTLTVRAGGPGIVVREGVALTSSQNFNASVAFKGSGDAVIDVPGGAHLYVQKSLYGDADVTLVKRGGGRLQNSDGYSQNANNVYKEARDETGAGAYYQFRKFVFTAVKIQGGTLDMRQHYWVRNCDLQFDGNDTVLDIRTHSPDLGIHDLVLSGCTLRETANVTETTHRISGETRGCHLTFIGETGASSFSGEFREFAGLVWNPSNNQTFTFKKSVSPTQGFIAVSNGTVRVEQGAGFSARESVTVSGAGAVFAFAADARRALPAPFALDDGGTIRVEGTIFVSVPSVTVDGAAVAPGVYRGAAGSVGTLAAWIDGTGSVIVGELPEAARTDLTFNSAGTADARTDTAANWPGAAAAPELADGGAYVTAAGGASMRAAGTVRLKGLKTAVAPFALTAETGAAFWLGSLGLDLAAGALALDAPVYVTAPQAWTLPANAALNVNAAVASLGDGAHVTICGQGGTSALNLNAAAPDWTGALTVSNAAVAFNVSGALGPAGAQPAVIHHHAEGASPTYAGGITVTRPLVVSPAPAGAASGGATKITCPANTTLTFAAPFVTTNGGAVNITAPYGARIVFNELMMSRNGGGINGQGTVVFKGPLHYRDRPGISGAVTVELHAAGNRLNGNMGRSRAGG